MEKHIFISYKHEDQEFAENLIHRIEKAGFKPWVDHDQLHIGDDWRNGIDEAIKNSFALIVIMSPEAKTSEYVTYEWAFAWGAGVKVLPIIYKDTPLHPRLEALQHLNFINPKSRPWDTLLNTIKKIADTFSSSTPPIPQNTSPSYYSASEQTKEFWLDTGRIFLEREDYPAALEAYRQAIILDPHDANAYASKSQALSKLEQYKEALTASEQAIRLAPNLANAYYNKGFALYQLSRYKEALAASEQAIRLDPNFANAYLYKGLALHQLGRYKEALAAYDQAIHLNPSYSNIYYDKGLALHQLGRYKEALATYDQAIRLNPNDTDFYKGRGNTFAMLGKLEEAQYSHLTALEIENNEETQ